MDLNTIISIIGTVASVGGAAWAWRQAHLAKNAATEAQQVKKQIFTAADMSDLSEVKAVYETTQKNIRKYASRGNDSLVGVDVERDAESVYKLLEKINELKHLFPSEGFSKDCQELEKSLQDLVVAHTADEIKKHGKEVYDKLQPILPVVRKEFMKKHNDVTE